MASRWMAPKLIKMRAPYSDHELMIMGASHKPPPPEVLDEIAELALTGGWQLGTDRERQCETCGQCKSANGLCGCDIYIPAQPRTLADRQEARRLAVAVQVHTRHVSGPRKAKRLTARDRRLATMGLR
jgi:hypothetical protein